MGLFDSITKPLSKAANAVGDVLNSAAKAVGSAVDDAGKAVSSAGKAVQNAVDSAGDWVDKHVDSAVDSFEHSSLGDNVVGHALGEVVKDSAHFTTGVASGATTLVSGTAELVGGVMQYASDSQFRDEANKTMGYIASHPGQVASAAWKAGVQAFEKDPAHAAGEIVGMVGSAVLTGGAGAAGDVGEGAAVAGDVADVASLVSKTAKAADFANVASKTARAEDLMDSAAIASKAAESAEAATRIGDATVSSTTSPAVQSIQDIADKFAKNLGVFGKDNASNSEILDEFNQFGHTADHLPGSPQASDAALQARVANGANAATRFTSLETAADAARQVPKAILERAAKDPQFADQLENFLNGGQKAVGTVFDTGKSVGEGFIKAPNGSIQQIDNLSKVYVRLQWSGGKAGAGSIKIFTLYPKAPGMPSLASPVVEDAGRAAETGEAGLLDFLRGGKPVEESSIPKDASNFHKLDDTHYSFVRNGQIHVRSGENYTVRNGDFLDFKRDALLNGETALKTIAGRNVAVFGIKDQKEADLIFQILEDSPIPDSLDHAKNIFVVDHIGHGTTPDWKPNGTYIAGLAGNNQGEIVVSREALRNLDSTKDVLYHEMGHNLDVTFGGGRSYGISSAPESPFGTGTVVSDYARTNPAEDFAETHRMVLTLLKNGLDNKGNAYYYLSRVRDLWLQAKYNAVLQPYGIRIPYLE